MSSLSTCPFPLPNLVSRSTILSFLPHWPIFWLLCLHTCSSTSIHPADKVSLLKFKLYHASLLFKTFPWLSLAVTINSKSLAYLAWLRPAPHSQTLWSGPWLPLQPHCPPIPPPCSLPAIWNCFYFLQHAKHIPDSCPDSCLLDHLSYLSSYLADSSYLPVLCYPVSGQHDLLGKALDWVVLLACSVSSPLRAWNNTCLVCHPFPSMAHSTWHVVGVKVKVAQSCLTLCDPVDYTFLGILQARILEWVAFPFSEELPNPGIEPRSPALQVASLPAEPPMVLQKCWIHFLDLGRPQFPFFFFFFFQIYLIYLFYFCLCWVFMAGCQLSLVWYAGATLRCNVQAHCGDFSCCGTQALGKWA